MRANTPTSEVGVLARTCFDKAENLDELIAQSFDSELMRQVVKLITKHFPNHPPRLFDNGKTFCALALGKNPLPSPDYEDAGYINIAPQKNYIALYIYDTTSTFEQYTKDFPKSSIGKGCLRIKNQAFLDKYKENLSNLLRQYKL
ncbi:MAG: DUF1801 domain-containing protein [Streptococcaceae bacterium]|nr:DUF1801 domain-containing protein [Streptococcaceae bacterium]